MPLFIFQDLVRKYSVPCTIITFGETAFEAGEPVPGERTDTEVNAAVISMSAQKVYSSGGHYTSADRDLYILKADDVIDMHSGRPYYLLHNGLTFKVEEAGLYGEDYADFNHYTLRRVDSFDV